MCLEHLNSLAPMITVLFVLMKGGITICSLPLRTVGPQSPEVARLPSIGLALVMW